MWLLLAHPLLGTLQPRHVTSLGIEPATVWFTAGVQSSEPGLNLIYFKNCGLADQFKYSIIIKKKEL